MVRIVVVVILSTIYVCDLTEEGFLYIVYHYYLWFYRGVVHIVVLILSTITV